MNGEHKMTDNEIIKALKCCNVRNGYACLECPYHTPKMGGCTTSMLNDAIDLIARQKAEIERLTTLAELGNMRANDYRAMRDKLKKANAEIENYKNYIEHLNFTYDIKGVKAEAIKEFAERLKREKQYSVERHENIVPVAVIDWIVKEMVGEQPPLNDVKCKDCEYLEFELPYAVCSKAYKGIVQPNDSCGKGKLKEMVGD